MNRRKGWKIKMSSSSKTLMLLHLYDMTFREDPSDFDDNLLYAARDRTRQLRSFKVLSLSLSYKEYEQLAIWFGDADMGVDVTNSKKHATTSPDPKNSGSNLPFASDD
ncbi:unnamed protein product [Brassica rapa]|uniref:Uncharacterized protein n=1 Tax=Brassica campestris TaxID=3711 RepID=A0A3P5YED6_BRACM|nr:unnamed protein product [Brassica rapa]VDC65987.1 unnamed protein product [Brassica rapa]